MVQESSGIILKSIPFSESSIISRVFTPDFGKISLIARGAKKSKSGSSAMLEPMNIVEFQMNFNESKDLQVMRDISIQHNLSTIRTNIKKMATGLVIVEILDKTSHQLDPSPILYRLVKSSISQLNSLDVSEKTLYIFFLIQFSKYSGFNPISENCHNCKRLLSSAFYNMKNGLLACKNCRSIDSIFLDCDVFLLIKEVSKTNIKNLNDILIMQNMLQIIEKYLLRFMEFHLHGMHNIKSLSFLNSVLIK
ncbi:MAG: DNA repair protein RecO [Candidatus Marinimicrobia bacterium]|nr:DNA repair protein RecO [Candidatus Neomarinimicrobiota bacterium]|tara:strand:- start:9128 stop:9877 length:750 start_codon:yes stop_codon:yes gene_type:complete